MTSRAYDVMVIGGGAVGAAITHGLATRGARVALIDGADRDFRASRANFGLIWVQSKGARFPDYQRLTRRSAALWAGFAAELGAISGEDLALRQKGGLDFCLGEEEFESKRLALQRMHNQFGAGEYECRLLDRRELETMLPGVKLGARVAGASFSSQDGDVDPLRLMNALYASLARHGVALFNGRPVEDIEPGSHGFAACFGGERLVAERVVVAAGLGSASLAGQLGLSAPLRGERGQILVTERLDPFLPLPASGIRQTADGTVMIGTSKEDAGFDIGTRVAVGARIAARAIAVIPALAEARFIRTWAGLRILSPDGAPIYAQSARHPGAYLAICHSGITLAAMHATVLAEGILAGALPDALAPFHTGRFSGGADVHAA